MIRFFQNTGKRLGLSLAFMATMLFSLSMPAFARDSISNINMIRIKVEERLRNLDPGDSLGNISEGDFSTGDSDKYHVDAVQWVDSGNAGDITVGSTLKVQIYLVADSRDKSNGDTLYYQFFGAYNSNNVRVTNGTLISAKRISSTELELLIQLRAVQGQYSMADNLQWDNNSLGRARWSAPENGSGVYEVSLFKEGRRLAKITTDALSLNFYPWMTEEGSYTFSVKTIPYTEEQKKAGKSSEEAESEVLDIQQSTRSNGEGKYSENQVHGQNGQNNSGTGNIPGTIGFSQSNGKWYFRFPNSQPAINTWVEWNGHWYHFNGQAEMETGWFKNSYGDWYYLDPVNGDMKTGWRLIDQKWYYLRPEKDGRCGAMLSNGIMQIGKEQYYFDNSGAMRTGWISLQENGNTVYYYFREDGAMAKNTTISGFRLNERGQWVK